MFFYQLETKHFRGKQGCDNLNIHLAFFISITRRACVRQNYCDRAWGKVGIVFSLALENNFNQTEIAIFLCRLCFIKGFPFSQLKLTYYSWCLCGDCKMSPRTTSLYIDIIYCWSSGIMDCMLCTLENGSAHVLGGVSGVASGCVSWGVFPFLFHLFKKRSISLTF